ncbi:hypothetical protein H1R20_g14079, partial [Candolleomyces eurysporus]
MSIPNVTIQTQRPFSEKPPSLSQQGYKMHPAPSLYSSKEISTHQSEYDSESGHRMDHGACPHRRACRSRRYFLPIMAAGIIISLVALATFSCMGTDLNAWLAGLTTGGGGDLVRRAAETGASAATDAGSGNNPIVDKKSRGAAKEHSETRCAALVISAPAVEVSLSWNVLVVVCVQKASSSWRKMVRSGDYETLSWTAQYAAVYEYEDL